MKRTLLILSVFLLTAFQTLMAQRTITGTVTSAEDDEPVVGANVLEEGTTNGTTSDVDGKYSLTIGDNAKNFVITFVGLKKMVVPIEGTEIHVKMEVDENTFDDVIVTAIAIKREKNSLGYATTTLQSDDINKAADRSPIEALHGKVAGLNISTSNGDPGSSTRLVLRGGTSILGNNQALIVVDGVPIDNSNFGAGDDFNGHSDVLNNNYDAGNRANDLNPQDIESITVLKGPAAAALYGSRAANGALIITTKSGVKTAQGGKKFKASYNSNFTFSDILKLPEYQNEFGQGGEMLPDSRENFSWGPKFDGQLHPWGQVVDGEQKVKPYVALPNNVEEFFDLGKTYNNNISLEGGNTSTNYYLSYNNIKTLGVVPTTQYQRNSLRFNVAHVFTEKLSSTATFNYTKTGGDFTIQGQSDYSVYDKILNTPRDISLMELKDLSDPFNQPETYYGAYYLNPWYVLDKQKTTNDVDRFNANASVTYAPVKWLDFTGRFGADIYTDSRFQKLAKYDFVNQNNPFHYDGKYSEDIYRSNIYNSDIIVSAEHTFDFGLGISGRLGNNIVTSNLHNTFASTAGLDIDGLYTLSNSTDRPVTTTTISEKRIIGAYGELNFDYKKYAFLNFSARNDWSSTLPEDNRSYFYPSVNAAFLLTKVIDIAPKILSYAKIRAGYAQAGNSSDPYLLTNVYVKNISDDGYQESWVESPYPSGDETVAGYTVSDILRNPELKPEAVKSWEVGTDLGFWDDRLFLEFTYYDSKSEDLILTSSPIAPSSGYTSRVINAGSVSNKGVELAARIIPVSLKNGFKWEVYGTFTKNKNEVQDLPDGVDQIRLGGLSDMALVARVGEPYGTFYGISVKHDPQGRLVVSPDTGEPIVDNIPKIFGSYQPDWMGSLGTSISWKGLRFDILFDTRQGGKIYSRTKEIQEFVGTSPNTLYNERQDFIVPNSVIEVSDGVYEENTTVAADYQDYWLDQSRYDIGSHLISASFTKLREVSLSYTFPSKWMKKTKYISGAELRVFGSNLALWTPDENTFVDPETSSYGTGNAQGFEFGTIPSLRNFGFGFKLDF